MSKIKVYALSALVALAFAACNKSNETPAPEQLQQPGADKVLAYIRQLGFPDAVIKDNGNEFIVEEDIIFPKNMQVPVSNGKVSTEQYYTGSLISDSNVKNIRLSIDSSLSDMRAEIDTAVKQWNDVPNSSIHWVIATDADYDVIIKNVNLGNGTCGQAEFPSNGAAGTTIKINKKYIAKNTFAQRQRTITHEMGHIVSIRHTNWKSRGESTATPVPGVDSTDALSLMNGGQCNSGATVLSEKDKKAAAALYPL